jgi:hypothetical protein
MARGSVEGMVSADGQGDAGEFTLENARAVLCRACAVVGLDVSGAELVRLGSNAVFRLASREVIVRIAPDAGGLAATERTVRVARWPAEGDFPATRLVPGLTQPAVVGGHVVTFWENAQDEEAWASLPELADLLRRLHWLEEPESLRPPYVGLRPALRADPR